LIFSLLQPLESTRGPPWSGLWATCPSR